MKSILKFKGLVIFYVFVALLTYALILRVERLEQNGEYIQSNGIVINLW